MIGCGFLVEAPNFLTRLTPVTVKEGDAVTLMVTISGTNPEVTWYREGAEITDLFKRDFTVSKYQLNNYCGISIVWTSIWLSIEHGI